MVAAARTSESFGRLEQELARERTATLARIAGPLDELYAIPGPLEG